MIKINKYFTFLIFIFLQSGYIKAISPIILTDSINQYPVAYSQIQIFEDKSSSLTIDDIVSPQYRDSFKDNNIQLPRNFNLNSAYWIRFKIRNEAYGDKLWLLEYFDSSIQQIILFVPNENGGYSEIAAGSNLPFETKFILHKNFEFPIPDRRHQDMVYYARVKSSHLIFMFGVIRSYERFASYALSEYYFLGIFYGIIVAMAIYNLLLFITVKDKTYLYYVLYVLSSGFLCMVMDGTGFQYLWPNHPEYNQNAFSFSLFLMVIWALMYTQGFVSLKTATRFHFNILELVIIIRTLIFILGQTFVPALKEMVLIDIISLLICYISGIISFKTGNISTRFFVIGFTLLFIGFIISNLTVNSIFGISLPNNIYTVYSFNVGIVLEMILLSYALADRVRLVMQERAVAQSQLIEQLKEREGLKEALNKELEQKVKQRTAEITLQKEQLEQKNEELKILYDEIKDNIKVAKWIQESILPPVSLIRKHLKECFVLYKPKDVVSGDFYWFEAKGDKKYIAAVDCTGHGVAGAFMSIIGYDMLNQIIKNPENEYLTASQILDKLNEGVIETLRQKNKDAMSRDGMDINLCIIDTKKLTLNYAGAVNYLYIIRKGELIKLIADSFSIGIPKSGIIEKFTNHEFQLEKGDMLIQYSDGYADQLGGENGFKKFLYPRFREMVINMSTLPVEEQYKIADNTIVEWMGQTEQTDDILLIGIKI
jgi:serine phosphatase RsbU (regulator of sigma subunit)